MSDRELGIYINDHLAGSTGGLSLAHRAARNATDSERTGMWQKLASEISEEREILTRIRDRIGVSPNRVKYLVAWTGEKGGRLKLNGYLLKKTDLGQMLELEMLLLGVTGKLSLWKALMRLGDPRLDDFDLEGLAAQAEAQRNRLEQFRISLVPAALGGGQADDGPSLP